MAAILDRASYAPAPTLSKHQDHLTEWSIAGDGAENPKVFRSMICGDFDNLVPLMF
jgi:hypothetical protein